MDTKQQKGLVRELQRAGYTVNDVGNRRHVRRDGSLVLVLPGDHGRIEPHAWRNAVALVRSRTGVDCRPRQGKGKKVQS